MIQPYRAPILCKISSHASSSTILTIIIIIITNQRKYENPVAAFHFQRVPVPSQNNHRHDVSWKKYYFQVIFLLRKSFPRKNSSIWGEGDSPVQIVLNTFLTAYFPQHLSEHEYELLVQRHHNKQSKRHIYDYMIIINYMYIQFLLSNHHFHSVPYDIPKIVSKLHIARSLSKRTFFRGGYAQ